MRPERLAERRTFRWNDGADVDRYDAVETCAEGLRWYRWSHLAHEGGRHDEALQSYEAFERDGALRAAPDHVVRAIRAHLSKARALP